MRWLCLLGLVALGLSACVAAPAPLAFQPQQLSASAAVSHVSSVRFSNLGFKQYDSTTSYVAYFCDTAAEIVTLTEHMAVARLSARPENAECDFSIWDTRKKKRVYSGKTVVFTDSPYKNPDVSVFDVFPSFYPADRAERTRVRVVGKGFTSVSSVTGSDGEGECSNIVLVDGGFTCLLPVLPAPRIDPNTAIEFVVAAGELGVTRFSVQAVRDEPTVAIQGVSTDDFYSGVRFTLTLSAPLTTVRQLPWSPVLVHAGTGEVAADAVFTKLRWNIRGSELDAIVSCLSCRAGAYTLHLGEALRGLAAPVIGSTVAILFKELPCPFARSVTPSTITAGAAESGDVQIFLSLDLSAAPRGPFFVTAGAEAVPMTAEFSASAVAGAGVLTLSPTAELPVGFADLTVSTLSDAGRVVTKCSVGRAFEITQPADNAPVVLTASRRFFVTGDPAAAMDFVVFSGKNLISMSSVRLEFVGRPKVEGYKCDVDAVTHTEVTCFLRNKDIKDAGEFAFIFYDEPGTTTTRSEGFFALPPPSAKVVSAAPVAVGAPARVTATVSAALPKELPLQLVLVNADETVVASAVQWTGPDSVVFVDAVFSVAGPARLAVRARYLGGDPEPFFFAGEGLSVAAGPSPAAALVAVYPSHLQLGALVGGAPTVLRLDIENLAMIAVRLSTVTVGGVNATILSREGAVYVSATVPSVAGRLDVQAFSSTGKALFAAAVLTVEADARAGVFVKPNNYAAPLNDDGSVTLVTDVVNAGALAALITADVGTMTDTTRVDKGGYTRFTSTVTNCAACAGRRVVLTFAFEGAAAISAGYQVIRRPEVRRMWPSPIIDFTLSPDCAPFVVTLDELAPRQVLVPAFPGVTVSSVVVDAATGTVSGCLVCESCYSGTFEPILVAPFTGYEVPAVVVPALAMEVRAPWRPEARVAAAAAAAASPAGSALATHQIVLLAVSAAILLAALVTVARRGCGALKEASGLDAGLLGSDAPITSV